MEEESTTTEGSGWDEFVAGLVRIAGYGFAALLLLFTGLQTYGLLSDTEGIGVFAPLGIVLFGGGMWYWWMVFRKEASSFLQLALAGIMFVFSLLMEIAAVSLHLGAVSLTFFGPKTPAVIITIAALINLAAKLFYPIFSAKEWAKIMARANMGQGHKSSRTQEEPPKITDSKPPLKELPPPTAVSDPELIPLTLPAPVPNGHPAD